MKASIRRQKQWSCKNAINDKYATQDNAITGVWIQRAYAVCALWSHILRNPSYCWKIITNQSINTSFLVYMVAVFLDIYQYTLSTICLFKYTYFQIFLLSRILSTPTFSITKKDAIALVCGGVNKHFSMVSILNMLNSLSLMLLLNYYIYIGIYQLIILCNFLQLF